MTLRTDSGYVPLQDPQTCEMCGRAVSAANTHSVKVVYAMPGSGYSAYQCANEQHYGCCEEHALLAAVACYFQHITAHGSYAGKGVAVFDSNYQAILNTVNGYVGSDVPLPPPGV